MVRIYLPSCYDAFVASLWKGAAMLRRPYLALGVMLLAVVAFGATLLSVSLATNSEKGKPSSAGHQQPSDNGGQQQEAVRGTPDGYVSCVVDPYYGIGKAGSEPCIAPEPDDPKRYRLYYCEGKSRANVDLTEDRCYWAKDGP